MGVAAIMLAQGSGSSGPWTPAALSPVEWWDFSDASTVTLDSGAISSIASKGSVGRTASQATAGNRPALSAAAVNGLDAASFDGSNDFLSLSGALNTATIPTVAQVFGRASSGIKTQTLGGATNGGTPYAPLWWTDDIRYSAWWGGSAANFVTHGSASTGTGAFQHVLVRGSTTTTLYQDGTAIGTPQTTSATTGDAVYLGRRGADYHSGLLCEVIVFSTAISSTDREKLEGYLAHKWGTAGALPGGHPYKAAPP